MQIRSFDHGRGLGSRVGTGTVSGWTSITIRSGTTVLNLNSSENRFHRLQKTVWSTRTDSQSHLVLGANCINHSHGWGSDPVHRPPRPPPPPRQSSHHNKNHQNSYTGDYHNIRTYFIAPTDARRTAGSQ